jgi:hypothetical protein
MIFIRNILVGVLWFIFISGSYVGWAALGVLAKLDKKASFTSAEIGWWVGSAVVPWGTVIPLIIVGLGFWFGFLPGFKRSSATASGEPAVQSEARKQAGVP